MKKRQDPKSQITKRSISYHTFQCPPIKRGSNKPDPVCAEWAFHHPLFYNINLMRIIVDYMDTFSSVTINRVFPILDQLVTEDYWVKRYKRNAFEYEKATMLPYRYDMRCDLHYRTQQWKHTPITQWWGQTYIPGIVVHSTQLDKPKAKTFIEEVVFEPFERKVSEYFHLDGPKTLPEKWTPIEEMLIHEFYEPFERKIFSYFPQSDGRLLSREKTKIIIEYFIDCNRVQIKEHFQASERHEKLIRYASSTEIEKNGQDEYILTMGSIVVNMTAQNVRQFIHQVLPISKSIKAIPVYQSISERLFRPAQYRLYSVVSSQFYGPDV